MNSLFKTFCKDYPTFRTKRSLKFEKTIRVMVFFFLNLVGRLSLSKKFFLKSKLLLDYPWHMKKRIDTKNPNQKTLGHSSEEIFCCILHLAEQHRPMLLGLDFCDVHQRSSKCVFQNLDETSYLKSMDNFDWFRKHQHNRIFWPWFRNRPWEVKGCTVLPCSRCGP